jgi:RNA polymerase sigma-70 factor (ECF subfamily)
MGLALGIGRDQSVADDDARLAAERTRLVRLCYRLTGDLDAAEDLAQETLLEAFRNAHKLHDPSGYSRWLSAIARNVCRRWNQDRGRDISRLAAPGGDWDVSDAEDGYDLDVELDRRELVELLDRALAMLPPESRDVLVERYVRESPHAEAAARLGLTEAAVAKRLERGRLRLKRELSTTFIHQSIAHGLADSLFDDWRETDIWCPVCGRRRLLGMVMPGGRLWLICKPCIGPYYNLPVSQYGTFETYRDVKGYSATHVRGAEEHHRTFGGGIEGLRFSCPHCGREQPYRVGLDRTGDAHFIYKHCGHCGPLGWECVTAWHLLATPEGQAFQREHPRMRYARDRVVDAGGVPAIVASFESVTGSARIEGVFLRDTFRPVGVHATPGG